MPYLLDLKDYRAAIHLDELPQVQNEEHWPELLQSTLRELGVSVSRSIKPDEALRILHGVLAPIDPHVLDDKLIKKIEIIASGNNSVRQTIDPLTLPNITEQYHSRYPAANCTSVWVGDITTLGVDAIINAANTELLGCRIPNHACIDNVIHSAAGPRLRDDCATIIEHQSTLEPVGTAKITRGYALKAKYVLHTVGPQLQPGSQPSQAQRLQLMEAYLSCLNLAAQVEQIRSIAFCAISTGIFSYPKHKAAQVALSTVADWLKSFPNRFERIVFNLYTPADATVYDELLNDW